VENDDSIFGDYIQGSRRFYLELNQNKIEYDFCAILLLFILLKDSIWN
jgi:hypothetical protein